MCEEEYNNREKNHKKYHMGLVTRQGAEKSLQTVPSKHFKAHYPVPPNLSQALLKYKVKMYHNSIFIAGKTNIWLLLSSYITQKRKTYPADAGSLSEIPLHVRSQSHKRNYFGYDSGSLFSHIHKKLVIKFEILLLISIVWAFLEHSFWNRYVSCKGPCCP